jgi:hypothetical protein
VTQFLRQGEGKVFKSILQVKRQMKREALLKLNRTTNEQTVNQDRLRHCTSELMAKRRLRNGRNGPRIRKFKEVV